MEDRRIALRFFAFGSYRCHTILQNNLHTMTLSMSPDENYYEKKAQLENEKLNQKVEALSEEERKQIYEKGNLVAVPLHTQN